jgi:hypothetical protein
MPSERAAFFIKSKIMRIKSILVLLMLANMKADAQDTKIAFTAHYLYQIPMGDLSQYYGNNSNVGANVNIKLTNNFTFGLEGQYLFGSRYKDFSLLGSMVTADGFIIGKNQSIEVPEIEGRGGNFFAEIGKIFPLSNKNKNSGIHAKFGLGYMFYTAYTNSDVSIVTQLQGNYSSGYNRHQSGLSFNSFIGYTFYGSDKLINGSAGIQMTYASMKYDGTVDFASGQSNEGKPSFGNILIGPKISFSILLKTIKRVDPKADGYFYN